MLAAACGIIHVFCFHPQLIPSNSNKAHFSCATHLLQKGRSLPMHHVTSQEEKKMLVETRTQIQRCPL